MNSVKLLYMADGETTEKTPLPTAVPSLIECKKESLKEEPHRVIDGETELWEDQSKPLMVEPGKTRY